MPILLNNAESQTSGTTVTVPNSAGVNANAFNDVVIGANMTFTYDNVHPAHGSNAFKVALTSTATAATYATWLASWTPVTELFGSIYYWCSRIPVSSVRLIEFRNGNTHNSWIGIGSGTNGVQFRNFNDTTIGTEGFHLVTSTLYRIEFHVIFNATAGETARLIVYQGDSVTAQTPQGVVTDICMGQGGSPSTCNEIRVGATLPNFSSTSGDAFYFDSVNFNTYGYPGPGPYTNPNLAFAPVVYGRGAV